MLIARLARVEADRRYARHVNFREGWRGFLWQGRFASFPLDGDYLLAAARYIELNPVRARLADSPDGWQWSSARAHISGRDDDLSKTAPLLAMVGDWRTLLSLTTKSTLCVATSAPAAPSAAMPSSTTWKPPSDALSAVASPAPSHEQPQRSREISNMSRELQASSPHDTFTRCTWGRRDRRF